MHKLILFLSLFIFINLLWACKKDNENYGHVEIRVVNETALPLSNVTVIDKAYGVVSPNQTTAYKDFTTTIYAAPLIRFYANEKVIEYYIGVCGTPQPHPIQNGRYTYTITLDNADAQSFNFSFTKD